LAAASRWPSPAIAPKKDPAAAPRQRVFVTIDADRKDAELVEDGQGCETPVCTAPCNRVLSVEKGARFHIRAPFARNTRSFELHSPQDPVVWLDYKATQSATHDAIYRVFVGTIVAGTALALAGATAVPLVESDGARTTFSAAGAAGLVLALPVSTVFGLVVMAYSESDVTFLDPRRKPDLKAKIR
jgi:hypothetical protein